MWRELVRLIKEDARREKPEYTEGTVGITALLYCPIKWELRKKYPEVEANSVEIDDGFLWEKQVKEAVKKLARAKNARFEEEKVLSGEVEGLKIEGHLDVFMETEEEVIGIEIKSPKLIILKRIPEEKEIEEGIFYDEKQEAMISQTYILQAKIQKYFLEREFPDKKVSQYLFLKGLCKKGSWTKKMYVVRPIRESISEEEMKRIVKEFLTNKTPRFEGECTGYCEFFRKGLCEGKEHEGEKQADRETLELLKHYYSLKEEMKRIEGELKKRISRLKLGNREVGWIEREKVELNVRKILEKLPPEEAENYLTVKWNRKEELVEKLGEEVVLKREKVKEFRPNIDHVSSP